MDGILQAARRGMDLDLYPTDVDENGFTDEVLEGDENEDDDDVDADARRQVLNWPSEQQRADQNTIAQHTDPYVQVERYHELLPPLLKDPDFRITMFHHFPPPTQHLRQSGDRLFDTTQYLALRTWVYDSLLALEETGNQPT